MSASSRELSLHACSYVGRSDVLCRLFEVRRVSCVLELNPADLKRRREGRQGLGGHNALQWTLRRVRSIGVLSLQATGVTAASTLFA